MSIKGLLTIIIIFCPLSAIAVQWDVTVLPTASIRYRGEGSVIPQSYVNRFSGETSPLYRLEVKQTFSREGYWGLSLWHTGYFGGGRHSVEQIPDNTTGGIYQTNKLNVGFTNFFVTYHRSLADWPVEALVSFSVVREIFNRREFVVQGVRWGGDDTNEISAEGFGFGLTGSHGKRFYARWRALANYYIQIWDAKTDCSAGQIFQLEGGLGARLGKGFSIEVGLLHQYWFILSQGNRRISVPGTAGAVISWNRQETLTGGGYIRLQRAY